MSVDSSTLTVNNKQVELAVKDGTIGPSVLDISKLYAQTGMFTYDPGFTSTAACESAITYIDGDAGVLLYRGYPIDQLAVIQVEQLFRTAKALMRTRPIYHSSDAAIRSHVFCSFLALILRKELDERCRAAGFRPEWGDVLRDLDRLQEVTISQDGREMTLRTPATGTIGPLFKAARIALPPNVRDASAA